MGIHVPVELTPEPDHPKYSRALAVTCCVHVTWHRIGYRQKEKEEKMAERKERKNKSYRKMKRR